MQTERIIRPDATPIIQVECHQRERLTAAEFNKVVGAIKPELVKLALDSLIVHEIYNSKPNIPDGKGFLEISLIAYSRGGKGKVLTAWDEKAKNIELVISEAIDKAQLTNLHSILVNSKVNPTI